MTDLLTLGASGIRAYSSALATVADNVANSQSAGYVRRSIQTAEANPQGDSLLYRNQINPSGSVVTGVTRVVDIWLTEDARIAGGEAGRASARVTWLEAAERSLDDGAGGVGASMTAMFTTADMLAADPSSTPLRTQFLQSVENAAGAFRATATSLQAAANGLATDAQGSVDALNTDVAALNSVNNGLRRARAGSTNQASLMDERDRLIDRISNSVGVTSEFDARGAATLRLAAPSGETLLGPANVGQVSMAIQPSGQIAFTLTNSSGATSFTPSTGQLAGLSEASVGIASRGVSLESLATQFVTDVNAAHQAGFDAQGNPGIALLTMAGGAATMSAVALAASDVAAADGISANGNLLSMSSIRGQGGAEDNWSSLVAIHSQATASARAQSEVADTRRDGADVARSTVSGVDLDQEAADLLRYQQAYEGAARVLQVARETLQSILNIF